MPTMTTPHHSGSRTGAEPWLSKAEVAAHYGFTPRTVERWVFDGCPSRLLGGRRRFLLSEVDDWLNRRQRDLDDARFAREAGARSPQP